MFPERLKANHSTKTESKESVMTKAEEKKTAKKKLQKKKKKQFDFLK